MKHLRRFTLSLLLALAPVFFVGNVSAMEMTNQSANIFKFQQKLANKGNAQAQYKLATMYEAGVGVDADIELARQWYEKSASAGVKAASDRNTFLTVKEKGYDKAEHSAWLEGVKVDAEKRNVEAMYLLGQLYYDGIGVKKDLNKSLALLTNVSSSGDVNVDDEIVSIRKEIDAEQLIAKKRKQQRMAKAAAIKQAKAESAKIEPVKNKPVKKASAKSQPVKTVPAKTAQAKKKQPASPPAQQLASKEQQIKAEKRRRYEKAMEQLRLEQHKIDELQSQVSGGEVASMDDEF